MHKFFCPSGQITKEKILIDDERQIHHMRDVLRLKPEAHVFIFDELGSEYSCTIKKVSPTIILDIIEVSRAPSRNRGVRFCVACAIPKKSKMDDIVDKLAQLGVEKIIPLVTERVIIKLDKKKELARLNRWRKIALAAAQQSKNNRILQVESCKGLSEVLAESDDYDLKLIPALIGKRRTLKDTLKRRNPGNILVFIGPEGDFTPQEVRSAQDAGCIPITLGDFVLRVETAAVAVASFIRLYEYS